MKHACKSFLVVLLVLLSFSCSKPEEVAPPDTSARDAAAEKAAAEKAAREAIAADVAKARELIVRYDGDEGDLDQAKEIIKSVLARDREYAPAYVELARLEYKGGYSGNEEWDPTRIANAGKFVRHAFKLDPELTDAHALQARVLVELGEFDKAEESLERAEKAGVAKEELDAIRARIAAAYDDEREAVRLADEVVASDAASPALKVEMQSFIASRLAAQGFRVEAQEAYEKAIALAPDRAWSYGDLAAFHLDHGYAVEGLRYANQAVEIRPYPMGLRTLARASIMRAEELQKSIRREEAEKVIDALVRKVPAGNPDVDNLLGDYYYRMFEGTSDVAYLDRAIEKYRSVMAADPDRVDVARNLEGAVSRREELASR